jgi:hypothetical protein
MIWYVSSKNGSDSNDGRTLASALMSTQAALNVVQPGDTLIIAPGIYEQDLPKRIAAARTANVFVTVAGSES